MLILIVEIISYARLIVRSETGRFFAFTYFIGWVVLASSGVVFFLSRIDVFLSYLPANLWLTFFSFGVLIISIIIFINPSNLIASPLKVYYLSSLPVDIGKIKLYFNVTSRKSIEILKFLLQNPNQEWTRVTFMKVTQMNRTTVKRIFKNFQDLNILKFNKSKMSFSVNKSYLESINWLIERYELL